MDTVTLNEYFRTQFLYATKNNPVINGFCFSNSFQYFIEDEFNQITSGAVKITTSAIL